MTDTVFILIVAHWAWTRHEVGWLKIWPRIHECLIQKSSISSTFVCQELDDKGGERLSGHECLFEWIRYLFSSIFTFNQSMQLTHINLCPLFSSTNWHNPPTLVVVVVVASTNLGHQAAHPRGRLCIYYFIAVVYLLFYWFCLLFFPAFHSAIAFSNLAILSLNIAHVH